jgi:hypothetical protein
MQKEFLSIIFETFKAKQVDSKVPIPSSNVVINNSEGTNLKQVVPETQSPLEKVSLGKNSASKHDSNSQPHALNPTPTKQQTITHYFNEPKSDKRAELDSDVKKQSTSTANTEKSKKTLGKENKIKSSTGLDGFVVKKAKTDVTEPKE